MDGKKPTDGWSEYQLLVLSEIARLNESVKMVVERQGDIREEISLLKYKSSLFGSIAGFFVVVVSMFLEKIGKM
jgi:hypothetical protein